MKFTFCILVFILSSIAFGQTGDEGELTGIVRDESGETIPGAAIVYKKDVTRGAFSDVY